METIWVYDRMQLYRLMQLHPGWSISQLAEVLQRSVSWVKKWRRRFREAQQITLEIFLSRSRAPKTAPHRVAEAVVRTALALIQSLGELCHQRVGPKRILYHLREDTNLAQMDIVCRDQSRRSGGFCGMRSLSPSGTCCPNPGATPSAYGGVGGGLRRTAHWRRQAGVLDGG